MPSGLLRRLVSPLLLLAAWPLAASLGLVSPQTLASPLRLLSTAAGPSPALLARPRQDEHVRDVPVLLVGR